MYSGSRGAEEAAHAAQLTCVAVDGVDRLETQLVVAQEALDVADANLEAIHYISCGGVAGYDVSHSAKPGLARQPGLRAVLDRWRQMVYLAGYAGTRSPHTGRAPPPSTSLTLVLYRYTVMNVNPPSITPQDPRTLDGRSVQVLTVLGLPTDDAVWRDRIKTFIVCNGYHSVLSAALATARRMRTGRVSAPWGYTVGVYNNNLAQLSYLYYLTHWAETGLRSQLDLHYVIANGEAWHRFPDNYLPIGRVDNFFAAHNETGIHWEHLQGPGRRREIVAPTSPADFLERVTMGWLIQMVIYLHLRTRSRGILVARSGDTITTTEATSLVETARDARNAVAHNRSITLDQYTRYRDRLLRLLKIMRYDVDKAVAGVESLRAALLNPRRPSADPGSLSGVSN